MKRGLRIVLVMLASASGGFAQGAMTAVEREALALAQQGLVARRAGRDAEALASFERALTLAPRASMRAQRGFALQALGRWVEAERALEALASSEDPWVRRHRTTLDTALAEIRGHLGWLEVSVDPAGGELLVDGVSTAGVTRLRWPAGSVAVVARREGYYPVERFATVRPQETVRETITLRPRVIDPSPEPLRHILPSPQPLTPTVPATTPAVAPPTPMPSRVGPLLLGGAGLVSVGVGVGLWLLRDGALRELTAEGCVETATEFVCDPRRIDPGTANERHAEASSLGRVGPSLLVVGGAMVIAGAAWMLVGALQRGGPPPRAGLGWTPGGVQWRF